MRQVKSLLVIRKILRLVVNTFTANEKYSLLNTNNLTQSIQMELSQKQKSCSGSFFSIFGIYIKFGAFSKQKITFIANVFLKIWTPKNVVRYLSKKTCFGEPFNKQHVKQVQTLLKYEREHLDQIY